MTYAKIAVAAVAAVVLAGQVSAQQGGTPIGQFQDWAAYTAEGSGGKVCFVISQPQRSEPTNVQRGSIYFYVTHRPDQGVRNEVSVAIGYPFREGSTPIAQIDSNSFEFMSSQDAAWIDNPAREGELISAMRAGMSMTVRGTSQRGTDTTDTYSLRGVSAALDRINSECS